MSSARPLLQVDRIDKIFPGRPAAVTVLSQLSFDVERGEFVCLVGPSGCGKSTLLQILAGLLPASQGEVRLDGERIVRPSPRVVVLFQQYAKSLLPWRTVEHNVSFALENIATLSRDEKAERVRSNLRFVGLSGYERYYPHQLSGGMQQRVAIARALSRPSDILLMDEPFSALDALTRAELQDLVRAIWGEGEKTLVFITHDIDEAVYLSTKVVVLGRHPGRVLQEITNDLPPARDQIATRELPRYLELRRLIHGQIAHRPAVP